MNTFETDAAPRQRLEYGAVPLRPWQARYPGTDRSYFEVSCNHLEDKAYQAVAATPEIGSYRFRLLEFIRESLLTTHTQRIDYNHDSFHQLAVLDAEQAEQHIWDEKLHYAYDGLATPYELLDILVEHPELKSLELAKLSHPLDFAAAAEMDDNLITLLHKKHAVPMPTPARYKRKRVNEAIPAMIVTRKVELGDIPAENGVVRVTRRQSLLVRDVLFGDNDPIQQIKLTRQLKNPARFDELTQRIESHLTCEDFDPTSQFVQPAATSYYTKFIPADELEA